MLPTSLIVWFLFCLFPDYQNEISEITENKKPSGNDRPPTQAKVSIIVPVTDVYVLFCFSLIFKPV